jgi:hypothetical protein
MEIQQTIQQLLAMMEANKEDFLSRMEAKMDANQTEMRSILCTFRSELKKTTACQEAMETEPDPRMMQSIEEHWEIPKEEATVMPVGKPRKRRRIRNLAAERRQKMEGQDPGKKRIQEEVGCRLQEGVPPCKSGMGKRETRQNWDSGKLWTVKGVLPYRNEDGPLCKSGTAQVEHRQK